MDIGFLIENEKHRNNRGIISSFSPVNNEIKHFLAKRQSAHLQYEDIPVDTEKWHNTAAGGLESSVRSEDITSQQEIMVAKLDQLSQALHKPKGMKIEVDIKELMVKGSGVNET